VTGIFSSVTGATPLVSFSVSYLANEVDLVRQDTEHDFYFEISMTDVWVWDIYRADRFVKSVRVLTFKDVNVEELSRRDFHLPEELSLDN